MAEAPRHSPHQIVPLLLFHTLHNKHPGLCWRLFVLPPYSTESYFYFLFTMLLLFKPTVPWKTSPDIFLPVWLPSLSSSRPFHLHLLLLSSPTLISHPASSCFPSLCWAPVGSFVSLSPGSDSRRGLIHVQCLHLFPPSNLCCQGFYSVWMAGLSCVCRALSWGVDTFLRVQHETDCSR